MSMVFRRLTPFLAAAAWLVPVGVAGIAASTVLSPQTTLAADRFASAGGGWKTYVNERFGTRLEYPAATFKPSARPKNGDGRRFTSPDATLEVYAFPNSGGETASSMKRRLIGSQGYDRVTYARSGSAWLVLSGFRGRNIFYEKYFFHGATIQGFGMEFPRSAKPRYAPIVERVENSFHAGGGDQMSKAEAESEGQAEGGLRSLIP